MLTSFIRLLYHFISFNCFYLVAKLLVSIYIVAYSSIVKTTKASLDYNYIELLQLTFNSKAYLTSF